MPENTSFSLQVPSIVRAGLGGALFFPALVNTTFTISEVAFGYSGPFGYKSVALVHLLAIDGDPATGASVYLNGTFVGRPNTLGFVSVSLPPGASTLNVSYQGYQLSLPLYGDSASGPAYLNGADAVLLTLSESFLSASLPIVAIALSFDAIARERAQGSLEILLCHRVRREGILVGKFLGALVSVALPVVAVLLAGAVIVAVVSGLTPTASFVAGVLLASCFLVAVYVLLMLVLSNLAKNVGTAMVLGAVAWFFFIVIFPFLATYLLFALGSNPATPGFHGSIATLFLLDPNLVFQMLVDLINPTPNTTGGFVPAPMGYVSVTSLTVAVVLWIVVPLVIATIVFRRGAQLSVA